MQILDSQNINIKDLHCIFPHREEVQEVLHFTLILSTVFSDEIKKANLIQKSPGGFSNMKCEKLHNGLLQNTAISVNINRYVTVHSIHSWTCH